MNEYMYVRVRVCIYIYIYIYIYTYTHMLQRAARHRLRATPAVLPNACLFFERPFLQEEGHEALYAEAHRGGLGCLGCLAFGVHPHVYVCM